MINQPPPPKPELAARLSSKLALDEIIFISFDVRNVGGTGEAGSSLEFESSFADVAWMFVDGQIRAIFPFTVSVDSRAESGHKTQLAVIGIKIRADYQPNESFDIASDESAIEHYIGISGIMHVWPYVRAEVQTFTSKLGLPPLTLPVIIPGKRAYAKVVKAELPAEKTDSRPPPPNKSDIPPPLKKGGRKKTLSSRQTE